MAKPGQFKGRLGYDLQAVFESYPTLGSIVINDQSAEEAFTFYDHPKVMIFKKNKNFNITEVQSILGTVDLTKAIHLLPREFSNYSSLLLPADKLAQQRAGGTWSDLFNYDWIQNRYPCVGTGDLVSLHLCFRFGCLPIDTPGNARVWRIKVILSAAPWDWCCLVIWPGWQGLPGSHIRV